MKVIEVHNLCKYFGRFGAVRNLSFEVVKGEIFGFLGANGAGKTTAMRMLCGLLTPTSGKGRVAGFDVYRESEKIKRSIGYMSQKFSLYEDLTTAENLELFGGIYGMGRKEIKAKMAGVIEGLELEAGKALLVGSLPEGVKQKVAFAVSTFHSPEIVFLDEPTAGVDPIARRKFWEMIYEAANRGVTSFVTTHYMDEAEYCNRVSILVDGEVRALASPRELKQKFGASSMQEVFFALAQKAKRGVS
ncbi:MAG: ABC transporter ATP-binding protein [Tannerellaceae bacterium]|jgi:ABC-2 type transport system ATP-binding protein|nr:ABC transporter ATP-binding protein [Tannerellaceae bacterium]